MTTIERAKTNYTFNCDFCHRKIPANGERLRINSARIITPLEGQPFIKAYDIYAGDICVDCLKKAKEGRLNEIIVK